MGRSIFKQLSTVLFINPAAIGSRFYKPSIIFILLCKIYLLLQGSKMHSSKNFSIASNAAGLRTKVEDFQKS
jgi:hypothetical protein